MKQPNVITRYPMLVGALLTILLLAGCVMPASPATASPATPREAAAAETLPPLTAVELADGARLQVVATTNIVADVVAQVGGDLIDLTPLMPIGVDPHSFTATPQDLVTLNEAHVIFINGLELEESLMPVLTTLDSTPPIVSVNVGVTTREFVEPGHDEAAEVAVEENHEHAEEHSAVAHACKHLANGPVVPITAVAEVGNTSAITGTHVRLDVTLPTVDTGHFAYTAEATGEYIFYADSPVTLTLRGADGNETPAETVIDAAALADCPGFITAFVFDLIAGDNLLSIHDAEGEMVRFVVEAVAGEHDHAAHEDEAAATHDHAHEEAGDEHHHHAGADPHTWFSVHAVEQWVTNIEEVLSALDPANAESYAANAEAYRGELAALESELDAMVAELPVAQRKLVTDHDAFGYFADAYDFTIIGAVIPALSTMAAPSASELAALQDQIQAEAVPAIFVGTTVNPELAEQLAADTSATVATVYTGSLSDADGPAANYLDFMRYDMQTIVAALQ